MTDEPDNALDDGVTDNVNPSDADTAEDWDYFDPDEDTEETPEAAAPDDEDPEGEAPAEPEDQPAVYAEDTAIVKLADGTEVPLSDLKSGYMRQSDYTRKTQELANERKSFSADAERMQRITTAFVDHLTALVPDPPPAELLYSNPQKAFVQQQIHDRAMAQVKQLIELGDAPKEILGKLSEEDDQRQLRAVNQRLAEMFPESAGGETRVAFLAGIRSVANQIGVTDAELSANRDPRLFALAHWAAKGIAAEKAKATAQAKVAAAPPATPRKPGQGARQANGNADAMRKLGRSGSIRDALAVDFD